MGYLFATVFILGIVVTVVLLGCWLCLKIDAIVNLLKGSRKNYYLSSNNHDLNTSSDNRRESIQPVIEINRGLFRRRSAIYGLAAKNWQITRVSLGNNAQGGFGADWVDLVDRSSLPVERALYLINKYPSLQFLMLENDNQRNRIAELESRPTQLELQAAKDNLFLANKQRQDWHAGIIAILRIIDGDKQRYRSQAAKNIRENLEYLRQCQWDYSEYRPSDEIISMWLDKLSKPEAKVVR